MRNNLGPAAFGLVMFLAASPWQTHNWGGTAAAALLAALAAHGVMRAAGLVKRAVSGPSVAVAPVGPYDRDRAAR
ncbi:hypothetical protein ACIQF6_19620 [Kitasatospora sp. NPDC092948]|uniref:hypothetical protein n=1 Tax=Kitasatospora sp. NPDC092948 TaxID=3364088 RepID=UPI003802942B